MKTCSKCKKDLSLDNFNKKHSTGVQPYCKECQRAYSREQYKKTADKQKKQILLAKQKRVAVNKAYVKNIKESSPCMDCGKYYPHYIMDFDHQHSKEFIISKAVNNGTSIDRIKNEISKCELVCANCHRERTFNSNNIILNI